MNDRASTGCLILMTLIGALSCSNGGAGRTGAGGSCWLGLDAGSCTDDSQCPSGDYCDFSSFETCAWDGGVPCDGGPLFCGPFGRAVGGICFPSCGGEQSSPCETDEDCLEIFACHASANSEVDCTREAPCPGGGVCWILGTPGPPGCPPSSECKAEAAPHLRSGSYCDCPELICAGGT